jgi:hypothetical protein
MENTKSLIARFWPTGTLFIIGFILIIYIAFGLVYFQQSPKQGELNTQINQLNIILSRPPTSGEAVQAEYDKVTGNLTPRAAIATIATLVSIAEQGGIDVSDESGKLHIPPAAFSQEKVGGNTYQLMSFKGILVQGAYENVMAFISNLESGTTPGTQTMVVKRVAFNKVEFTFTGVEGDRRAEFRNVASAVADMMNDNGLSKITNPISSAGGVATNLMGDKPDTAGIAEGFPDITTTIAEKGYSGNATPRGGYVLYKHDKVSTGNATQYQTVDYFSTLTTKYYYTCEADGTVRQWDGQSLTRAKEYVGSEKSTMETKILVDVDIYSKPK